MELKEFDYVLPRGWIAQEPVKPRDHSRLMVVDRVDGRIIHDRFYNLPKYLTAKDTLVFNDTKVWPARLMGRKETGGQVEVLLLRPAGGGWEYAGRETGKAGHVRFGGGLEGTIIDKDLIKFNVNNDVFMRLINRIGYTPIPHYIKLPTGWNEDRLRRSYQTVYARNAGSAAAPTAGLHFTHRLLRRLDDMGVDREFVTLHVGLGTFAPVRAERIQDHVMHSEFFRIDQETRYKIQTAKNAGKRIIVVGTTGVRVLETWARAGKTEGETDIFIYPGYKFKLVDALITNFHLPKSTLLMLVCAFAGRELILKAYQEAIRKEYRFYSFGDAMLIV